MRALWKATLVCAVGLVGASSASADELKDLVQLCAADLRNVSSDPLSGSYVGMWDGKLPHLLTIVQVERPKVVVYYSTTVYVPWGIKRGNCSKIEGTISGDKISLNLTGANALAVYAVTGDVLTGVYSRGGVDTPGTFKKVSLK
jgi:hypothetical protein